MSSLKAFLTGLNYLLLKDTKLANNNPQHCGLSDVYNYNWFEM
jgi:hypothetical protein